MKSTPVNAGYRQPSVNRRPEFTESTLPEQIAFPDCRRTCAPLHYFDEREPVFVLIHLKNGNLLVGYFGSNSYATSFPNQGDLYLEAVYEVAEDGTFGEPIEDTDGMIITNDDYHYVELFTLPTSQTEEAQDE